VFLEKTVWGNLETFSRSAPLSLWAAAKAWPPAILDFLIHVKPNIGGDRTGLDQTRPDQKSKFSALINWPAKLRLATKTSLIALVGNTKSSKYTSTITTWQYVGNSLAIT
jgi:hypothetical protein